MDKQILIVIMDTECSTEELARRIEEIREMPGVLSARTLDRIVVDCLDDAEKTGHKA